MKKKKKKKKTNIHPHFSHTHDTTPNFYLKILNFPIIIKHLISSYDVINLLPISLLKKITSHLQLSNIYHVAFFFFPEISYSFVNIDPKLQSFIECWDEEELCDIQEWVCGGFKLPKEDVDDSRARNLGYFNQSQFWKPQFWTHL